MRTVPARPPGPLVVVGPGAVGGVLCAYWTDAGQRVAVLGRTPASETLLVSRGLSFSGLGGAASRLIRNGFCAARGLPAKSKARAVFFCVRAEDLPKALSAATVLIGPRTVIVALQNGGRRLLRSAFGTSRLVEGVVRFGALRRAPGDAVHVHGRQILLAPAGDAREAFLLAKRLLELGGWDVVEGRRAPPQRSGKRLLKSAR